MKDEIITESDNPKSLNLHEMNALEIVELINDEDKKVAFAVEKEKENIARAVELIVSKFKEGGNLYYFGAGTSGRLGVLDASECSPTFNFHDIKGIIAGGDKALRTSIEGAEDDFEAGKKDGEILKGKDVAVLISASGNPNYLLGVQKAAKTAECPTIALTDNPKAKIIKEAQISICPVVGAEVVSGSSRMKAGTAQKMVLNMLSTASMVLCGKVYKNKMINLTPVNEKLKMRAIKITAQLLKVDEKIAEEKLKENDFNILKILNKASISTLNPKID